MSKPIKPTEVILFFSVIYKEVENFNKACEAFKKEFGDIATVSDELQFSSTDYYENEFGKNLNRRFVFMKNIIDRTFIITAKLKAYEIENKLKDEKTNRIVNIDPGLVTLENIVLSTFKNYSHRIYLGRNVYAEITLIYSKNSYRPLEWTYPDYKKEETIKIFNMVRYEYLRTHNST